jgi:hypothetical protein
MDRLTLFSLVIMGFAWALLIIALASMALP